MYRYLNVFALLCYKDFGSRVEYNITVGSGREATGAAIKPFGNGVDADTVGAGSGGTLSKNLNLLKLRKIQLADQLAAHAADQYEYSAKTAERSADTATLTAITFLLIVVGILWTIVSPVFRFGLAATIMVTGSICLLHTIRK